MVPERPNEAALIIDYNIFVEDLSRIAGLSNPSRAVEARVTALFDRLKNIHGAEALGLVNSLFGKYRYDSENPAAKVLDIIVKHEQNENSALLRIARRGLRRRI